MGPPRSSSKILVYYWSWGILFFSEISLILGAEIATTEEPFNSFAHFIQVALLRSGFSFLFLGLPSLCFWAVAALVGALEFPEWWLPLRRATLVAFPIVLTWCLALLCSCTEVSGFWFRESTPQWTHLDFWDVAASFWWLLLIAVSGLVWWLYSIFSLPSGKLS